MIHINSNQLPWQKGLTVEKLLKDNNFIPHLSVVKVNNQIIKKQSYDSHIIHDEDDIKVIHLVAGG